MVIMHKIQMFLGVTSAEICLKMHYFCNNLKNGQVLESNSTATGGYFSGPRSFCLHLITLLFVKLPRPGDSEAQSFWLQL